MIHLCQLLGGEFFWEEQQNRYLCPWTNDCTFINFIKFWCAMNAIKKVVHHAPIPVSFRTNSWRLFGNQTDSATKNRSRKACYTLLTMRKNPCKAPYHPCRIHYNRDNLSPGMTQNFSHSIRPATRPSIVLVIDPTKSMLHRWSYRVSKPFALYKATNNTRLSWI